MKTLPSRLIKGPVLIGFATAFDRSNGDEETEYPYPVVTPSTMGPILLPFRCPHCGADCSALVDPDHRMKYFDKLRKFSWCPTATCRKRFFVNRNGMPLPCDLYAGSALAPAQVKWRDREEVQSGEASRPLPIACEEVGALHMLGAM